MNELEREVLLKVLRDLVGPMIARNPPIDEYSTVLAHAIALEARNLAGSVATAAVAIGQSERWVRMHSNAPTAEPSEHALLAATLLILFQAYPQALTAEEIQKALSRRGFKLSLRRVSLLMEAFTKMGQISRRGSGYQAKEVFMASEERPERAQLDKMQGRVKLFGSLCPAYAEGRQGAVFGKIQAMMAEEDFLAMLAEIEEQFGAIIRKYVERTQARKADSDTKMVEFNGILTIAPRAPLS